jgi:hypothetical protein
MVDLGYADAKRRGRQKAVGFAAVYQTSPATFKHSRAPRSACRSFFLEVEHVETMQLSYYRRKMDGKFCDDEMKDKWAD